MIKRENIKYMVYGFASTLVLAAAQTAFAAEGGEEGGGEMMGLVWKLLNFVILIVALAYFGKKPLASYLAERTATIKKSLGEAREAKELAQKALDEVKDRLKTVDKEVAEMIASSKASGERERAQLIEDGKSLSARILEQAKANIDFEVKRAKDAIRDEAVRTTMDLVEKHISEKLSDKERKSLLEEALVKMEGRN